MTTYTLPFAQCSKDEHHRVGGKCASLGAMIQANAPVPPGFAVTTNAYEEMLGHNGFQEQMYKELDRLISSDDHILPEVSRNVRGMIEARGVSAEIRAAICEAYAALCRLCEMDDVPVAVRSSATAEDLPDASFAGQQDTYLWIVGAEAVIDHVCKCWSSLFTDRAIAYRLDKNFPHHEVQMGVAVQKMVNAKAAGVAFTLNPINGDRSKVAIDSSWGLGEAVVSGEVTPDNFLVDKVILSVVNRVISPKQIEYAIDFENGRTVKREIEPERQTAASLTEEELIAVTKMAKRAEKFYRAPQDVEWAIDADLPAPDNVVILQSRPETVWSRKKQESVSKGRPSGMMGMVHTLRQGVQIKKE